MKKQQKNITNNNISGAQRPIDVYFNYYNQVYKSIAERGLLVLLNILLYFAVMGIFWIIPFPKIKFLSGYNGFINWASFVIAALVYYWLKKSPLLSYFLLLILFGLSYFVTKLQELMGVKALVVFVPMLFIAVGILMIKVSKINRNPVAIMLNLPLWLVHFLTKPIIKRY